MTIPTPQEVQRLTQPVLKSEWEQLTARADAAEARVRELEQMLHAEGLIPLAKATPPIPTEEPQ
jgi:hypothetical protein